MTSQYEKNSVCVAAASYRNRCRIRKLRGDLVMFFSALTIVCALLYIIISSL